MRMYGNRLSPIQPISFAKQFHNVFFIINKNLFGELGDFSMAL